MSNNKEENDTNNNNNNNNKLIKVVFGDITKNNFNQLKQLNNLSLPVRYQSGFYLRIINHLRYGRFAYFNDIIVGAITWKYDHCKETDERGVYIMTINVLDAYKRNKIGSQLLQELIRLHKNMKEIKYIYLHVQVCNEIAKNFYLKNGFEIAKTIENYYTDIEPKGAYYLKLKLDH
jgi:ribosomal protein S18 acetylase RimI-like enzyme